MKTLFLVLIFSSAVFAGAPVTLHQTKDGAFPAYFPFTPGDKPWDDEMQTEYDEEISGRIHTYCENSRRMSRAQEIIANEKQVGKETGYVNTQTIRDSGAIVVELRPTVEKAARQVKELTHKDIKSYGCDDE